MYRSIRLAVLVLLLALTTRPLSAEWLSDVQSKMGTRVEVQLWSEDTTAGEPLLGAAMAEFDRIEAAMSTYRPESAISRVNTRAAEAPVSVSPELFALVDRALQLSMTTSGAFDITYDSVGQLYDYRAGVRPADADIEARLPVVDYRHIELDRTALAIRFSRPGVRINLGGIAKGHAVESVIGLLRESGVQHALASAGGDTRLLGDRRGKPWIVGIRDPDDEAGIVTRVALDDEAVSTSGDYERFFDEGEIRYHHIINPDTGRSATAIRSVTVIGPDATMTDGLSTSVFVLGVDKGLALIESLPDYETIIIDAEREVRFSTGLDPR
jgi:thiamine biosynthesis lipoprotein